MLDDEENCVPQKVIADYKLSYRDLLLSVFTHAITEQKEFLSLDYTFPGQTSDWPSWLPELDADAAYTSRIAFYQEQFCAASSQDRFARQTHAGLQFRATRVGKVTALSPRAGITRAEAHQQEGFNHVSQIDLASNRQEYKDFAELMTCHGFGDYRAPRNVLLAWNCGMWARLTRYHQAPQHDQDALLRFYESGNDEQLEDIWTDSLRTAVSHGAELRLQCRACILAIDHNIKSIGQTHLVCWTPEGAAIGDEVVLIHGMPLPFLTRMVTEETRMFQGVCYVHSIMDGEVFEGPHSTEDLIFV